jgi:hypothetical protein
MKRASLALICLAAIAAGTARAQQHPGAKQVVVYKEPGRFGGWPANHGIWSWGDEIVVGFSLGYFKKVERGHAIDGSRPSVPRFARSLDGGETWTIETPSFLDADGKEKEATDPPGGINFTHPDFAMTLRMVSSREGFSRFYYSTDRCRTWKGPHKLPTYGRKIISARTDYIVNGKHDLMAFITSGKENGREGRVFVTRTTDGGKTWPFVSWIGEEPPGFSIMPSSVRLSPTKILSTLRQKEGDKHWIDAYISEDDGKSWRFLNRPAESTGEFVGNPPSMIMLKDGRLAVTYGYRSAPYQMRARLSSDNGKTWGKEIILRAKAGCEDLGYPRTVQRADGKIVTLYYISDERYAERFIEATIWDPGPGKGLGFEASASGL